MAVVASVASVANVANASAVVEAAVAADVTHVVDVAALVVVAGADLNVYDLHRKFIADLRAHGESGADQKRLLLLLLLLLLLNVLFPGALTFVRHTNIG